MQMDCISVEYGLASGWKATSSHIKIKPPKEKLSLCSKLTHIYLRLEKYLCAVDSRVVLLHQLPRTAREPKYTDY